MAKRGKEKTKQQAAATQDKAVRFLRDVVGDNAKANEIEGLTVSQYAERKGLLLVNPAPKSKPKNVTGSEKKMSANLKEKLVDVENEADDLDGDLQEAHETMDDAWNAIVDCDKSMSKEELLGAIEAACEALNDYDSERFPVDEDASADDEQDAA